MHFFVAYWKNETHEIGPQEALEPYKDPGPQKDSGPYEDPRPYEDLEFFDDPGKTQELINQPKFLDFQIFCLIWWNLQLKADLFNIAECRYTWVIFCFEYLLLKLFNA